MSSETEFVPMKPIDRIAAELRALAAPDPTDRDLVDAFRNRRDDRAFAKLLQRHGPMVLGVCRRILRHDGDAEDAFQATFLIFLRKVDAIADPDRLAPWLYGVAWRVARKLAARRRPCETLPDVRAPEDPRADSRADWPAELDDAIARLPAKYRDPIVLCHLQGYSTRDAGHRLGCSAETIATRLVRARRQLRRTLERLGITAPTLLLAGAPLSIPSALAATTRTLLNSSSRSPAATRLADGILRSDLMLRIRFAAGSFTAACLLGLGMFFAPFTDRADGQELPLKPPTRVASEPPLPLVKPMATPNFRVTGVPPELARVIAEAAERHRKEVAIAWLGAELPDWKVPCKISIQVLNLNAGGATSIQFVPEGLLFRMKLDGPLDRILSDLLPHEVTHTVLADRCRSVVPRWADEGMAYLSESAAEQIRHLEMAGATYRKGDFFNSAALFALQEYPRNVMAFYLQSFWYTKFLVEKKDRPTFVAFIEAGKSGNWEASLKTHYGYPDIAAFERDCLARFDAPKTPLAMPPMHMGKPGRSVPPVPGLARLSADGRFIQIDFATLGTAASETQLKNAQLAGDGRLDHIVTQKTPTPERTQNRFVVPLELLPWKTVAGKPIAHADMARDLKANPVAVLIVNDGAAISSELLPLFRETAPVLTLPHSLLLDGLRLENLSGGR
jgi:RNA polymerase sigma factor (sigma-70 family)